ncbi:MAG: FKBP-type peptidyl-prolyl cis-trans isomerase [Bacteroidota bacterium]
MKHFSFLFAFLILIACGDQSTETDQQSTNQAPPTEDELIQRLMAEYKTEDGSLAAKQHNEIINYAIDNRLDLQVTESGLFYQILSQGEGDFIEMGDRLTAHYKGTLLDGTVFDSSYDRQKPIQFNVGQMIPGWNEGLQFMQPGSNAMFICPSRLAYQDRAFTDPQTGEEIIPPNSILRFDLEVTARFRIPTATE